MKDQSRGSGLSAYFVNTVLTLLPANMFHYSMILLSGIYVASPAFTGIVFFCIFLPISILTPLAGKLLDRNDRKILVLIGQSISLMALVGLAFLVMVPVHAEFVPAIMIMLSLVMGASLAFVVPARLTFLADIADEKTLPSATAFTALLTVLGFGLAPVTVDFIQSRWGWSGLGVCIVAFQVVGMGMLAGTHPRFVTRREAKELGSFRGFLSGNPIIFQALIVAALMFTAMGPLQVLLPNHFVESLGVSDLQRGMILSWLGGGMLLGALGAQAWVARSNRFGRGVIFAGLTLGAATGLIAFVTDANHGGGLLAICGAMLGFGTIGVSVLLQQSAGDEHRGQIMAAFSMCFQLVPAMFALVAGFIASNFGVPMALALSGGLIVLGLGCIMLTSGPLMRFGSLAAAKTPELR